MADLPQAASPHRSAAGISLEEQELSRALEASLAENQVAMAKRGMPLQSLFVDPLNPHERKRRGRWPVGLKNIGNTCWFSAVIQVGAGPGQRWDGAHWRSYPPQSLFHIPAVRKVILAFQPLPLREEATGVMVRLVVSS